MLVKERRMNRIPPKNRKYQKSQVGRNVARHAQPLYSVLMCPLPVATARNRLLHSTASDADLTTVLNTSLAALHEATTFTWAALMAVDPETILPTCGVVEGFNSTACGPFWDFELSGPGYNKFTALARSMDPVATLYDATDGDLLRSPAFAQLFWALGAGDELRAVFILRESCWGIVSLLRSADDGPFPETEVDAVRRLCPTVARALRQATVLVNGDRASQTAMLVFDPDNGVVHMTDGASCLLADMRAIQHIGVSAGEPLGVLTALVTRARSNRNGTQVSTRLRSTTGVW